MPIVSLDKAGIAIAISLLACMGFTSYISYNQRKEASAYPRSATIQTASGSNIATVEVQTSKEGQRIGLSGRSSISPGSGMLFPVKPAKLVKVWMKDMRFPIDILFVKDNRVIQVVEKAPPCKTTEACPRYMSESPVDTIIELHPDTEVKVGTELKIMYTVANKE